MRHCGLLGVLLVVGCGPESEATFDTGVCDVLTHQNFGAAFMVEHCQGCHNSALAEAQRAGAPTNVFFDTEADVIYWLDRVYVEVSTQSMPPMGGIDQEEQQLALEWLDCLKEEQQ